MIKPTRIVDAHQHVFWHGRDDKGLVADMDECGIDYAWLLSWEIAPFEQTHPRYQQILNPLHLQADGAHAGIPLSDLVLAHERYPQRFVLGYCPHPLMGDAPARLQAAIEMYGIRVCGEWKFRIPFDDPRCLEIFRIAGKFRLPVVLHLDVPYLANAEGIRAYQPYWYGGTIDNLERALQACPDTTFVGHAPGFWREISADAAEDAACYPRGPVKGQGRLYGLFDRHSNLYADLSAGSALFALQRDTEHAVRFLTRYSNRLLFGRDGYGQDLYDYLQGLDLSQDAFENIYHRNAEQLVPKHQ